MYCQHCMNKLPDDAQVCDYCHHKPSGKCASHHLAVGTVLNQRYLIGEAIGEGGFGITYIGLDLNLDIKIAVKEFFPYGYANRNNNISNEVMLNYPSETGYFTDVKNRFLEEAKGIAKFSKESAIVDVRDYFTENNTAYIVMEYIEGITLAHYLEKYGVFEPDRIFELMMPLMNALTKIHKEGLIHRDISPENIMMTDAGNLMLMDFGSARFYSGENKRTMSVVLKPGYAPFEQYSTEGNQGPWTDVYALCGTLYKCITGITPPDAMVRCQTETLKPPAELGIQLKPEQEKALEMGLKVYSDDRLQSVNELIEILTGTKPVVEEENKGFVRTLITKRRESAHAANRTYGDAYTRFMDPQADIKKSKMARILPFLIGFLVFVLVAVGVTLFFTLQGKGNKPTPDASTAVTQVTAAPVTTPPTEEETVAVKNGKVVMPDVTGKEISVARKQLVGAGLAVEEIRQENDSVEKNYVISQSVRAKKKVKVGTTVKLYVSDGTTLTERPTPSQPQSTEEHDTSLNVLTEVTRIRVMCYETQQDPGVRTEQNGVIYYRKDGAVKMAVCESGHNGWDYTREYYYDDGQLYYAVVYDDAEEHYLYYADGKLIRYIDSEGTIMDYGSIDCPMESVVTAEARTLME